MTAIPPDRYAFPVLDVALALHGSACGTSDPLPPEDEQRFVLWLKMRLDSWTPSKGRWESFDNAVRLVMQEALRATEEEARAKALRAGALALPADWYPTADTEEGNS